MPRLCTVLLALWVLLSALDPDRVLADSRPQELRSGVAALAGWTATTGLMVGLAAMPIARCDQDLACLGTAILSIGSFVLAHPLVAAAGVHWSTRLAGDRQPYWHSLVGQLAGDTLAVTAFALAVKLAPPSPRGESQDGTDRQQRRSRALAFTLAALLSLSGPLALRPLLDEPADAPSMARMALSF